MFQFTGNEALNWFLAIAGNFFIGLVVYRGLGHYARDEKGALLGHLAVGILIAGFIYFPKETITIFKGLWSLIFQGHV